MEKNEHRPLQHRSSWKDRKIFKNLQKLSNIFKNLQKPSKIFKNLQKSSKIFKNLQNSFKNLQIIFKNLQMIFKNLQNIFKISSKNLQKSSNNLIDLQKFFEISSLIFNFFWNFFIDLQKFFEISSLTSKHMVPNFQHAVPKTVSGLKVSCLSDSWVASCPLFSGFFERSCYGLYRSEWTKAFSLTDFEVQLGHQEELGQGLTGSIPPDVLPAMVEMLQWVLISFELNLPMTGL